MLQMKKRIGKRLGIIFSDLKIDILHFPISMCFINFIKNVACLGGPMKKILKWAYAKRKKQIFRFLYKENKDIFEKYKNVYEEGQENKDKYIWICWFQGEDNAPLLVKKCINSIRQNAGDYKVVVIDLNTYNDYINLSSHIVSKFESGKIGFAHFSDILRVNLINTYGGLWLDATIFCTKNISSEVFDYPFFSCKSPIVKGSYISEYQWTTFLLAGKKGCTFYSFMCDFYDNYWKNNDAAVDYLFMDYTIALAKTHIPCIAKQIENVPVNNLFRDELQNKFNEPFDEAEYKKIISGDTYLFKTSWRMDFKEQTEEGKQTYYGYFINNI